MALNETKPWYASQTVLGAGIALVAGGLKLWGYNISPEMESAGVRLMMDFFGMVGAGTALVGRVRATKGLALK